MPAGSCAASRAISIRGRANILRAAILPQQAGTPDTSREWQPVRRSLGLRAGLHAD
jgi:hypothetical protein